MPMQLKTIEVEGTQYAEVKDGKPVYIDGDKEIAFDADHSITTISRLNGEAQGHREAKDRAETAAAETTAKFEGLDDIEAAKRALKTVKNLDDKKLIEAGEVDSIKNAAIEATKQQFVPVVEENADLKSQLHKALIGDQFSRSVFVAEKLAIPVDFVESKFSSNFKLEAGLVVATDSQGNKIYSRERPGELASFEEAIEHIITQHPKADSLLKGRQQQGGDSQGGDQDRQQQGGAKISSEAFGKLSPKDRAATMAKGTEIVN